MTDTPTPIFTPPIAEHPTETFLPPNPEGFTVDCYTLTLNDGGNTDGLTPDEALTYCNIQPMPQLDGDGFTFDCSTQTLFDGLNSAPMTGQEVTNYCPPVAASPATGSTTATAQPVQEVPVLAETGAGDGLAFVLVAGVLLVAAGFAVFTGRVSTGRAA